MKKLMKRKTIILLFLISSPIVVLGAFLKIMFHNEIGNIANAILLLGVFVHAVSLILFIVSFLTKQDSNPQPGS